MKWFYIYSDKYKIFHELAQLKIPKNIYDVNPIYVEQHKFDKVLYQVEGKHPWQGCSIKLLQIVKCIEDAVQNKDFEPFLFTDIDIYVGGLVHEIAEFIKENEEFDMAFMREGSAINMGYVMIKPSAKTLAFWKDVLQTLQLNPTEYMEQPLVWEKLQSFDGMVGFFPTKLILSCNNTYNYDNNVKKPFAIFHILSNSSTHQQELNQKIHEYYLISSLLHDEIIKSKLESEFPFLSKSSA